MEPSRLKVSVVFQTHWDREWYFSHEAFVTRLLRAMDRVATLLETNQIAHFLFDGQTAAFADLLANAEPDLVGRVRKLAADGRLILGPWFVMADEFLVSGESLIRNLEIGMSDAISAGNCQRVGYLPDTFGHVAQMPQILREFNIDSAVVWRGVDCAHAEFDWRAPDGSMVGAIFLTEGYYQHPLNLTDYRAAVSAYVQKAAPRGLSEHLLLTQGGDHLLPHAQVKSRIAECNATQGSYVLVESTLADYAQSALAASRGRRAEITGELRANALSFLLPDVLSTRRYLKLQHQTLEDRLIHQVEPLFAQLEIATPHRALEQVWRSLIELQAHDSICGCSVDEVHRSMEQRFSVLGAQLDGLVTRAAHESGLQSALQHGADKLSVDDATLTLFNPRLQAHEGAVRLSVFLEGAIASSLSVRCADGISLRNTITSVSAHTEFFSPDDDFPDVRHGHRYQLVVWATIDAMACLAVSIEKSLDEPVGSRRLAARMIENSFFRVEIDSTGALQLVARKSGQTIAHVLSLRYEMDAGDSYNFSPPIDQVRIEQPVFSLRDIATHDGVQEMRLAVEMEVPAALSADRRGPSEHSVRNHGVLTLCLIDGERAVQARLQWTNAAMDQRTRLVFGTPAPILDSVADSAFVWQQREIKLANYPTERSRAEMSPAVLPSLSSIEAGGLFVHHRAMHEFEILGADTFGVTLVRSVGWMSRRDLLTRGVGAGPDMATPEAQCLRDDIFEFQFGFADSLGSVHTLDVAEAFRRSPFALRGVTRRWRSPLDIENPNVRVSALRMVDKARELRVWNPTDSPQTVELDASWSRVYADGRALSGQRCIVAPHAIATWRHLSLITRQVTEQDEHK